MAVFTHAQPPLTALHGTGSGKLARRHWLLRASSNGASPSPSSPALASDAPSSRVDPAVLEMLQQVAAGVVPPDAAAQAISNMASGTEALGDFAIVDSWRQLRTGFPEVVWGLGKSPHQIAAILQRLAESQASGGGAGGGVALATRVEPEAFKVIRQVLPEAEYHPLARIVSYSGPSDGQQQQQRTKGRRLPGTVMIVSAGTSDLGVVEECRVVAEAMGCYCATMLDCGVAGLHRILGKLEAVRAADVVVVVAGMDGALPSVVAGLVESPVIAVPTSIGYGAAFGGVAPLLGALNTCSPGVSTVNIDNGVGAAMVAARILAGNARTIEKLTASMAAVAAVQELK